MVNIEKSSIILSYLLSKQGEDVRVILLGHLDLREEISVELKRRGQVVQRLFKVTILEVSLSQLCVGSHQDEQILLMDVHEQFAKGELLDPDLNHALSVLRHREFVQSLISLHFITKSSTGCELEEEEEGFIAYVVHRRFCSPSERTPVRHPLASVAGASAIGG